MVWPTVPVPAPTPEYPVLFLTLPDDHVLVDAIGLPPADYFGGWYPGDGTTYLYEPPVVRDKTEEVSWRTTVIADPVGGVAEAGALILQLGVVSEDGALSSGIENLSRAIKTAEGNVYWLSVPLLRPTVDIPGRMFVELPDEYELDSVISLARTPFEEGAWQREGATSRWVYRPEYDLLPVVVDEPWLVNVLARPRVQDIIIGVNGYCSVGDVIRATNVRDAPRLDVIAFIENGFDHINAQFNISSIELKLVPPIEDQDLIDALKRLNIDFASARLLLSINDPNGDKFLDRFDNNLGRMVGKLTKKAGKEQKGVGGPARTLYGGDL